jgi:hypothetical protein
MIDWIPASAGMTKGNLILGKGREYGFRDNYTHRD